MTDAWPGWLVWISTICYFGMIICLIVLIGANIITHVILIKQRRWWLAAIYLLFAVLNGGALTLSSIGLLAVWEYRGYAPSAKALEQMKRTLISKCTAGELVSQTSRDFCTCWVNRWVQLWDDNDFATWRRKDATPHMEDMEIAAAKQCVAER